VEPGGILTPQDDFREGTRSLSVAGGAPVVGFAPGGAQAIAALIMGQWLAGRLGHPFVIENAQAPGAEAVVRAPADGYTPKVPRTRILVRSRQPPLARYSTS